MRFAALAICAAFAAQESPAPAKVGELPSQISAGIVASVCGQIACFEKLPAPSKVGVFQHTCPRFGGNLFAVLWLCKGPLELSPVDSQDCDQLEDHLESLLQPLPVEVPRSGRLCQWEVVRPGDEIPTDLLLLSFSSPISAELSPCGEPGFLAVLGFYGQFGASVFWVPLQKRGSEWQAGEVRPLEVFDYTLGGTWIPYR